MGWAGLIFGFLVLGEWFEFGVCEELKMVIPPKKVTEKDTYLCTSVELPKDGKRIIAIEPNSDQSIAHHMLLFGCDAPNKPFMTKGNVWNCRQRASCKEMENTLYGWGKNAPKLNLPDGVGFTIGGHSGINHLVLQVHYLNDRPDDDATGVTLTLSEKPSPLTASMITFATNFVIPPGKESFLVPNTCCLNGFQEVTTMAFRVHTHTMGRSVFMTRISGVHPKGVEVARNSPQLPQGFYPVEKETRIRPGEHLRVTCDFNSEGKDHVVGAGHNHDDEMCNMYMMIYSEIPHFSSCGSGYNDENLNGPGGLPADAILLSDDSVGGDWKPPIATEEMPEGIKSMPGVALAPSGSIWVFHRADAVWSSSVFSGNHTYLGEPIDEDVVVELDPDTGSVKRKWGKGIFYMPHMITVDFDGYIWVADVGLHQVLKFNQDGELLMELGRKLEPGSSNHHFCKPTQVEILNDGKILVADGYCNSRVMFFEKDGTFIKALVDKTLRVVHSLLADECKDMLYVADRENGRIVEYRLSTLKRQKHTNLAAYGLVWALSRGPYDSFLALVWKEGQANILALSSRGIDGWEIPGSDDHPHDITIGPAPMSISGVENRYIAVYVAATPRERVPAIEKYILVPESLSEQLKAPQSSTSSGPQVTEDDMMDAHAAISQRIHESQSSHASMGGFQTPDDYEGQRDSVSTTTAKDSADIAGHPVLQNEWYPDGQVVGGEKATLSVEALDSRVEEDTRTTHPPNLDYQPADFTSMQAMNAPTYSSPFLLNRYIILLVLLTGGGLFISLKYMGRRGTSRRRSL